VRENEGKILFANKQRDTLIKHFSIQHYTKYIETVPHFQVKEAHALRSKNASGIGQ